MALSPLAIEAIELRGGWETIDIGMSVFEADLAHSGSAADPLPEIRREYIGSGRNQHPDHHAKQPGHVKSCKRCCTYDQEHEQGQRPMAFVECTAGFG